MPRTPFTRDNHLVSIGIPCQDNHPSARYSTAHLLGGVKPMKINYEPQSMWYLPTIIGSDIKRGDINSGESASGNISVVLCRDLKNEDRYDPATSLLIESASRQHSIIYVRFERYIGFNTDMVKHSTHVRSSAMIVKSSNTRLNPDTNLWEQEFILSGYGEYIDGYVFK